MTPTVVALVALGSGVGSAVRHLVARSLATSLPWATFTVNVVASFGLGVVLGGPAPVAAVAGLGTGFCAGLSTWSTLGHETVRLAEQRRRGAAVLNVVVSTLAGLAAAGAGLAVGALVWA